MFAIKVPVLITLANKLLLLLLYLQNVCIRGNRKKVTAVRNFDCLKVHQRTILKREDKNHFVAVCPPGSWLLTI